MKKCRVVLPFTDKVTGRQYKMDDEVDFTEERIAEIKAVNVNMVLVIGEAELPFVPVPEEVSVEELIEEAEKPKKRKKKE